MKVARVHPDENKARARRKLQYVKNGRKMCSSIFVALPKGGGTYSRDTSHRFVFCLKGSVRIDTRFYWDEVMMSFWIICPRTVVTQSQLYHFTSKHSDCTPQELIDSRK